MALALDGLELDPDVAELAVAASLLLVAALRLAALADGLTVRHARILECDLDAELILQLGQRDLQMLGAQTADDLLLRLGSTTNRMAGSSSIRRASALPTLPSSPFLATLTAMR